MVRRTKAKRQVEYLPEHLCCSFDKELDNLVEFLSLEGFKGQYLKSEYKSKYIGSDTAPAEVRRTAAIKKFLLTDRTNSFTNARLQLGDETFHSWLKNDGNPVNSDDIISKARSVVADVLGPLAYPQVLLGGSHTNGASTRVTRSAIAGILKHSGEAHVSDTALKHWLQAATGVATSSQVLRIQNHSVLFTVPKATDIDRVACKEPEINMFLQRTVGLHIRRGLKAVGIDLNDQSINQDLARDALHLKLCTIDLSAASDSISKQLVFELLPFDWWSLMDDLRVHKVDIDGDIHDLEMFSSMGNGFTFELESLLFYALVRAIAYFSNVRGRISVYGDDIVAPSVLGPRIKRTFSWFGFKVNAKKSFWSGPFRESCGKHYHHSLDVSPFYLREPTKDMIGVIRILNRLLLWDSHGDYFCFLTEECARFHKKWAKVIPKRLHGGIDPERIDSLVTGSSMDSVFARDSSPLDYCHESGMIYWLTTREASSIRKGNGDKGSNSNPLARMIAYQNYIPKGVAPSRATLGRNKISSADWYLGYDPLKLVLQDLNPVTLAVDQLIPRSEGRYLIRKVSKFDRELKTAWSPYLLWGS